MHQPELRVPSFRRENQGDDKKCKERTHLNRHYSLIMWRHSTQEVVRVEEWRPHANNFPRKDRDNQGHQVPVTNIQPEESCVRHQTVKEILTLFLLSDREACPDWAEYLAEEAMVELLHT